MGGALEEERMEFREMEVGRRVLGREERRKEGVNARAGIEEDVRSKILMHSDSGGVGDGRVEITWSYPPGGARRCGSQRGPLHLPPPHHPSLDLEGGQASWKIGWRRDCTRRALPRLQSPPCLQWEGRGEATFCS